VILKRYKDIVVGCEGNTECPPENDGILDLNVY